ncbi:MFS transporter [Streptomyces sp. Caat 7-52]|uniref:MFS transporter n=1 Tax=Streptomyces sp. Caat 7-52 TaxID=2949637 RepID=UPI0020351AB0|nr:MFS transporter [Streptomyces sp. Caat 7-52]
MPLLVLIYFLNFLDRVNVGYASLTMNKDLGLTASTFGLGAGLFFIGYFFFEVPSNLVLHRVGARLWIARIMITWGVTAAATAFVHTDVQFFVARFLLGVAEAGLFPGVILYMTYWFPARERARITALFLLAIPLSSVVGSPLSTAILQYTDGWFGQSGWRVMFLLEGVPSVLVGICVFFLLPNGPAEARWLTAAQRRRIIDDVSGDASAASGHESTVWRALLNARVITLSVVYFGLVYGLYALSFFLPQLVSGLAEEFGTEFSLLEVGLVSSIPFVFASMTMWWAGRHSDRTGERVMHTAFPAFLAALGLAISLVFSSSPYVLMAGLVCLAAGIFASIPPFWSLPSSFLEGTALAGGIGLINSFGNLSGFVGPYLTGWFKDWTGDFHAGLAVVAGFMALSGALTLMLRKRLEPYKTAAPLRTDRAAVSRNSP